MQDIKVALVTGATRGIGNATAVQLASEGFAIAASGTGRVDRCAENIGRIRQYGTPFMYVEADISRADSRYELVKRVTQQFGRIDVLVNNAGVAPKARVDILETTEESMDHVIGINLKGTFFLTQAVSKVMIEQSKTAGYTPRIINISSISAYTSSTQRGEYCISKAGLSMVTSLFADRLAEHGINVYEVRPGIIMTDMTQAVREKYTKMIEEGLTPVKRWGSPEDVANAVSVLCSDKLLFSTGEVINVDGGFHIRRL